MKEIILIAFLVGISYAMALFRNVVLALELKISNHILAASKKKNHKWLKVKTEGKIQLLWRTYE